MAKKIPIGIENFEKIRKEGFYYIDKSMFIAELIDGWCKVHVFTRPPRFGRTLNMSMIKSFFEIGKDPQLFEGLAITKEAELCDKYMGKYPVVHISMKSIDGLTYEDAKQQLTNILVHEAERYRFLLESDVLTEFYKDDLNELLNGDFGRSGLRFALEDLTSILHKHFGKSVIVLIDDYDVPLVKSLQNGYYEKMLDLIRGMFVAALKGNEHLCFAVLNGCLGLWKNSIFGGFDNYVIHSSSNARFEKSFGLTEDEMQLLLGEYNLEERIDVFKEWYGGYHFGEQDVYCPLDVMKYIDDLISSPQAKPRTYRFNSDGNTPVRRLIEKSDYGTVQMEIESLIDGQAVTYFWEINDQLTPAECEKDTNLWSLLYMTGYLTMKDMPSRHFNKLTIPNEEVREIFEQQYSQYKSNE